MWLHISSLIILWTFRYPWICPAVHHHRCGDSRVINKLFPLIIISQEICSRFNLFCRIYTSNSYCTHVTNPFFPGLSSMQCGHRIIVELSVKHARMKRVNLIIRRQQLSASTEHKISITCIILSVYCIYIYMAYSQLMRYQLYEQNICVCIFIRTKIVMRFPFIKRALIDINRETK